MKYGCSGGNWAKSGVRRGSVEIEARESGPLQQSAANPAAVDHGDSGHFIKDSGLSMEALRKRLPKVELVEATPPELYLQLK